MNNILKSAKIYLFSSKFRKVRIEIMSNYHLVGIMKGMNDATFPTAVFSKKECYGLQVNGYLVSDPFEVSYSNAFDCHEALSCQNFNNICDCFPLFGMFYQDCMQLACHYSTMPYFFIQLVNVW